MLLRYSAPLLATLAQGWLLLFLDNPLITIPQLLMTHANPYYDSLSLFSPAQTLANKRCRQGLQHQVASPSAHIPLQSSQRLEVRRAIGCLSLTPGKLPSCENGKLLSFAEV